MRRGSRLVRRIGLLIGAGLVLCGSGSPSDPANRLGGEMSPYLQLHAHNPVDWYPWGEEALARARAEDKPIFLSVGYSTCYWCHVMEREVFANPEIAALMNRWFVNIKVDREERPELDEIYMTATQLLTGRGGWPNSVFLTPDLEPFFAGTYFPPEDRNGLPGFPRVLESLADAWEKRRAEVTVQAKRVSEALRRALTGAQESAAPPPVVAADRVVEALKADFDGEWGGFGQRQKFPSPGNLKLLWSVAQGGDDEARRMVLTTLAKMGQGAIYDQLEGGFHRYTLDRSWRVPHFEKMLYDNAQLGEVLALVAAAERDPALERLARGTLDFVLAQLTLPNGAFKSAIDAETDAVEGAFYIWTRDELEEVLGDQGVELLAPIFGFDGEPNFEEHHYTLFLTAPLGEHAERLGLARIELLDDLEPHLEKLARFRSGRKFPLVDDKVLTDWNGMMVAALARAGTVLGEERYLAAAERAARFLLNLVDERGRLLHVWRDGVARIPAYLDDYAFLIDGLLALGVATGEPGWRDAAARLAEEAEQRLAAIGGGYHASGEQPDLLVRARPISDGAIPSANGVMVNNLLELARAGEGSVHRQRAAMALGAFSRELASSPRGVVTLAGALYRFHREPGGLPGSASSADSPAAGGSPRELARSLVRATATWRGEAAGSWRPFELELTIADGWHLNANPASRDFLIPTRVGPAARRVRYPPGERFRFAFADAELEVYGGTVRILGEAVAGSESHELTYQACDDRRCLPPLTIQVPATVDSPRR